MRPSRASPALPLLALGLAVVPWAIASAQTTADNAAAAPVPAAAAIPPIQIRSTRDLVAACNTPSSDPGYPGAVGLCVGYGSGVVAYHLADTRIHSRARKVCLPADMPTRDTVRQRFITWAQANDGTMDEPAVQGVMRFLIATYPCGK